MGKKDTIAAIALILGILMIIIFIRVLIVYVDGGVDVYCEYKFGEEYYYEYQPCNDRYKCARECQRAIIDNEGNVEIESKYFLLKQIEKDCRSAHFFNIKEWYQVCGEE